MGEPTALQPRKHTNVCNKQLVSSLLSLLPCLPYGVMPLVSKEILGVYQVVQRFLMDTKRPRSSLQHRPVAAELLWSAWPSKQA